MKKIILFLVGLSLFTSCKVSKEVIATVTVKKTLDIDRNFETVEVDISDLAPKKVSNLVVLDSENKSITSQIVDTDLDSNNDVISAGLTLHKKDGKISQNKNWISYWEPFDDSELGQGLVTSDAYFINSEKYVTSKKDESNFFANLKVVEGKVIYYAGFGWKKSNQFKNQQEWESYLNDFLLKINNPLLIALK